MPERMMTAKTAQGATDVKAGQGQEGRRPARTLPAATVSIIIPTYNHALYLPDAIESALNQTVPPAEVIVVDDGSTDHPQKITARYPAVLCLRQDNRGLSAARNTGARHSRSDYLVFLDADDLLYPDALARNLFYFQTHPGCAFISGGYDLMNAQTELLDMKERPVPSKDYYHALLAGNYIGMHAAVMYRREIFSRYQYDETLRACEDYDLYLRMARDHPVFAHGEKLAAYRRHGSNMSGNLWLMKRQADRVLKKAADRDGRPEIRVLCRRGRKNWRTFYAGQAFQRLKFGNRRPGQLPARDLLLALTSPEMLGPIAGRGLRKILRLFLQILFLLREQAKRLTRDSLRYRIPRPGHVSAAHLRRTTPLSTRFGHDRGGPVDRWYIENFLAENAPAIRGRVLESGGNACTLAYGGDRVTGSDVLHVDPAHPGATFSCGLGRADAIPSDIFDCIILTQALHLIYDFQAALDHCHRILKPGGTLLMTVPGISQLDHGEWKDSWYWSFTPAALRKMLAPRFGAAPVIRSHGNVLAATAFLYGMGAGELSEKEKRETDPHYPLVVTAAAIKPLVPCVP